MEVITRLPGSPYTLFTLQSYPGAGTELSFSPRQTKRSSHLNQRKVLVVPHSPHARTNWPTSCLMQQVSAQKSELVSTTGINIVVGVQVYPHMRTNACSVSSADTESWCGLESNGLGRKALRRRPTSVLEI